MVYVEKEWGWTVSPDGFVDLISQVGNLVQVVQVTNII